MASVYGNTESTASGNSSFRVVCEYTATNQNNGYYQYRYRFYVQVTKGNFYGSTISTSWGRQISMNGVGKYAYSSYYTKNVAYGSKFTLGSTAYAQYTGSSTYRSEISGSKQIATVPTPTYTVKYNANGGSGAPSSQTKTYGKTLKLSSTKPTRTGYTFQGWGTSSTDTSVNYAAGANYTSNAAVTLYAIWKVNTYTVTYNANGGSGAPSNQTKTHGVNLTLSSTRPTRTDYTFLGWGTSESSTTVEYAPGASYTANASITLYAIWELAYAKPKITNMTVDRCTSSGALSDEGTYALVKFDWSTEKSATGCTIQITGPTISGSTSTSVTISGKSGSVSRVVGSGSLSTEYSYDVEVVVRDSSGENSYGIALPAMKFILDFLHGGNGLAIGKPATNEGFEIAWNTLFEKYVEFSLASRLLANGTEFLKFSSTRRPIFSNHFGIGNGKYLQGELSSGSLTDILGMNALNQVELNWTTGGLKGRVMKELWTGTWTSGSLTISELPYYNILLISVSDASVDTSGNRFIPVFRSTTDTFSGIGVSPLSNKDTRFMVASFASSGTQLSYNMGVRWMYINSSGLSDLADGRKVYAIYGLL